MRRAGKQVLGLGLGVVLALAACAGSSSDGGGREASPQPTEEPAPVSEQGKKWGGWRWKGDRQNCIYVHDNECFAERKQACRAAGCGESRCRDQEDTAPIKVRCRDED